MGGYFGPANLEMSYALVALKRNEEAITNLQTVSQRDGKRFPITFYHLGRLYEAKGDLKTAEDYYSRAAVAYGDNNSQFLLEVSRVREKQGNLEGALSSLEESIKTMERLGEKPDWAEGRLAALKQKLAESKVPPKP
jgi:tetratricopeptide (TPR) repeat protein